VKALTKWFECYPSPLEAEALGLRGAISWLGELGLSVVQIELDCKLVVEGIMDKSNNQSDFGNIMFTCRLQDCKLVVEGIMYH
jgi:ribonuclease HI